MKKKSKGKDRERSERAKGARAATPQPVEGAWSTITAWGSRPWVVAVLLGVLAALLCGLFFSPPLSTIGDNAQYVVLGKSLLAGKGLTHINDPNAKPHTKYPFMFPLMLAGVLAIAPESVVALKLMCVVACVGAALLYYPVFRREGAAVTAAAASVLAVMSPDILRHSSQILAEVPYLGASFAVLGWVALGERRWSERIWVPIALLLVMIAYYIKSVGLTLAGGVVLALLVRARFTWALGFLGGFILLALPWAIRTQRLGSGGTYFSYLLMKNPYLPEAGTVSPADMAARIGENVKIYFSTVIPQALAPFTVLGPAPGPGLHLLWFALSCLVGIGLIYRLRRHRSVMDFYLLLFLGICVFWPTVWASVRFVVPVIPLLLLCLFTGLRVILIPLERREWGRIRDGVLAGTAVLMAFGFGVADRAEAAREQEYTPAWRSYFAAARWARENTPPESVFVCRKPYLFFLESHRRAMGYRFSTDLEHVIDGIELVKATHVVIDRFRWTATTAKYLVPAMQWQVERFPVLHITEEKPETVITRFVAQRGGDES